MKQYLVTMPRYNVIPYSARENSTTSETIYGEACWIDKSGALHFYTNYEDDCSFYAIASGHWISVVESTKSE